MEKSLMSAVVASSKIYTVFGASVRSAVESRRDFEKFFQDLKNERDIIIKGNLILYKKHYDSQKEK